MTVTLSPIARQYAVSDADDPFKKYWWAILMGIVFTAIWLLTPMLGEKSVGSTVVDTSPKASENVEQSFTPDAGDGINLSMEGTGRARKEDPLFGSSLYQAPPEEKAEATAAAALGSASGASSGGTLAGALKKVGESDGGWGGKKKQRGFDAPRLAGASLSGMGAASGGKAGSASGSSAFGSSNAKIGFAGTKGLSGGDEAEAAVPAGKGLAVLKAASAQSLLAAASKSNDDARSSLSKAFDGAKGGEKIGGGGASLGGGYAALDAAPVNLKLEDPKLNEKKIEPPSGADVAQSDMTQSDIGKQIAMQLVGGAIGTAIGGPMGAIVSQAIMQAIQRQEDQAAKVRELEEKRELERLKNKR